MKKILKDITNDKNIGVNSLRFAYVSHYFNKLYKLQLERVAFLCVQVESSVSTLQNHHLKIDVSLMDDEPEEPEPKQQQEIINKINKIVVEKPIKKEVELQLF